MAHKKSTEELLSELQEQVEALILYCDLYDTGRDWAAKDIAKCLHLMLHDSTGNNSKSLLGSLKLKGKTKFLSSVEIPILTKKQEIAGGILYKENTPLIVTRMMDKTFSYAPTLDSSPFPKNRKWLKFEDWYEEPIYKSKIGNVLKRKTLIFRLRSQDGGAHVDIKLRDESYIKLKNNPNDTQHVILTSTPDGVKETIIEKPTVSAERACMRQLGYEVVESLKPYIKSGL